MTSFTLTILPILIGIIAVILLYRDGGKLRNNGFRINPGILSVIGLVGFFILFFLEFIFLFLNSFDTPISTSPVFLRFLDFLDSFPFVLPSIISFILYILVRPFIKRISRKDGHLPPASRISDLFFWLAVALAIVVPIIVIASRLFYVIH